MQPLQICIGPTIRIGRESWCLPYAGFLVCNLMSTVVSIISIDWCQHLIFHLSCCQDKFLSPGMSWLSCTMDILLFNSLALWINGSLALWIFFSQAILLSKSLDVWYLSLVWLQNRHQQKVTLLSLRVFLLNND